MALTAVIFFRDEAPAFPALDKFDGQFLPAVSADGISLVDDPATVRTLSGHPGGELGRKEEDEEKKEGEDKTEGAPDKLVSAFLIGDEAAGHSGEEAQKQRESKHVSLFLTGGPGPSGGALRWPMPGADSFFSGQASPVPHLLLRYQ